MEFLDRVLLPPPLFTGATGRAFVQGRKPTLSLTGRALRKMRAPKSPRFVRLVVHHKKSRRVATKIPFLIGEQWAESLP